MKPILICGALVASLSACAPAGLIDSDMERGLVGAAIGYGAAKAIDGNPDRGAIAGGLAGVFCDDFGGCAPARR